MITLQPKNAKNGNIWKYTEKIGSFRLLFCHRRNHNPFLSVFRLWISPILQTNQLLSKLFLTEKHQIGYIFGFCIPLRIRYWAYFEPSHEWTNISDQYGRGAVSPVSIGSPWRSVTRYSSIQKWTLRFHEMYTSTFAGHIGWFSKYLG